MEKAPEGALTREELRETRDNYAEADVGGRPATPEEHQGARAQRARSDIRG